MDTSKVTRFEVIDETGRAFQRYDVSLSLSLQDDGRTLKVFIGPNGRSGETQRKMVKGLREWLAGLQGPNGKS